MKKTGGKFPAEVRQHFSANTVSWQLWVASWCLTCICDGRVRQEEEAAPWLCQDVLAHVASWIDLTRKATAEETRAKFCAYNTGMYVIHVVGPKIRNVQNALHDLSRILAFLVTGSLR